MVGVNDSAVAGGVSSSAGHLVVSAVLAPVLTRRRFEALLCGTVVGLSCLGMRRRDSEGRKQKRKQG